MSCCENIVVEEIKRIKLELEYKQALFRAMRKDIQQLESALEYNIEEIEAIKDTETSLNIMLQGLFSICDLNPELDDLRFLVEYVMNCNVGLEHFEEIEELRSLLVESYNKYFSKKPPGYELPERDYPAVAIKEELLQNFYYADNNNAIEVINVMMESKLILKEEEFLLKEEELLSIINNIKQE